MENNEPLTGGAAMTNTIMLITVPHRKIFYLIWRRNVSDGFSIERYFFPVVLISRKGSQVIPAAPNDAAGLIWRFFSAAFWPKFVVALNLLNIHRLIVNH